MPVIYSRNNRGNLKSRGINKPYLIIIANSARMLAQAARREGYLPLAIDCYGDQDTQRYAEEFVKIPALSEEYMIPAINEFKKRYPVEFGIYGAGFEQQQASLAYFCNQVTVLGNQPAVFAKLHDKPVFFAALKKLGIPFPEVTFNAPQNKDGWLIKPMQGQGGVGVRHCSNDINGGMNDNLVYWQRFQAGIPHSVLFLADGQHCQIIGFNRQWTEALSTTDGFIFSGIMNHTELTEKQRRQLTHWINHLVSEISLKGLNSLDFIQDGTCINALEINPRPPASMQLYQGDLLTLHLNACRGELPGRLPQQMGVIGLQIVYARQDTKITDDFYWPEGSQDIPGAGSIIGAGQPICSMIRRGTEPEAVMDGLKQQEQILLQQLTG